MFRFKCYLGMLRMMPLLILFLMPIGLAHCSPFSNTIHKTTTNDLQIVNITIEKFSTNDFKRIAEYFNGGHEYFGRKCVVRDDPDTRAGMYFIVNFNKPLTDLPKDVSVNIFLMLGKSLDYEKFSFKLPNKRPSLVAETYLGITSKRTDRSDINAWRIELIGPNGEQITSNESYMWPKGIKLHD